MIDVLDTALFYKNVLAHDVIPDHPTEKYPVGFNGWQEREFTADELKQKIGKEGWGIGIRNQEGLDFDNKGNPPADELFSRWQELVEAQAPGLVSRLTIETTPSGGYHAVFKCPVIEGNQKLATRPATPEEKAQDPKKEEMTLIETRGLGGQFMVAPSPGYEVIQGGWANLQEITPEEREILLDCARALDVPKKEPKQENGKTPTSEGDRPGDIYNQQHTNEALELLQRVGWTAVYTKNETTYLRRPGKKQGVSATFNYLGSNVLYVFSSNASPFEMEQSYSPFAIYTTLEHGGDFGTATKSLANRFSLNGHNPIINSATEAPEESEPEGEYIFKPLTFSGLLALPPKEWHVLNLVGRRDLGMLFSESGNGKTFVIIDLLFDAALGLPFAGKFFIPKPLKVAYCAGEGSEGLKSRFAAAANRYGVAGNAERQTLLESNLTVFTRVPQLYDGEVEDTIYCFVNDWQDRQAGPLDILCIDTLHSATFGADENHSRDAGIVLRAARYAIDALGCTVFFVHHANRAGTYRGSSALHGAMDTMLQVKYDKEIKVGTLECFKLKDAEAFEPVYFKLIADNFIASAAVKWVDKVTVQLDDPAPKTTQAKVDILSLLSDKPKLNQSAIVAALPVYDRKTVRGALEELETSGEAVRSDGPRNSKLYELSHTGQLDRTTDNSPN